MAYLFFFFSFLMLCSCLVGLFVLFLSFALLRLFIAVGPTVARESVVLFVSFCDVCWACLACYICFLWFV